jgi:glycosyltransferase involved in cell wall biosynthesis
MEGGVPPRVFQAALRERVDDGTFVVASAGSLDEANGTHLILEAFKRLTGAQYRLVIAGSGSLEGLVRKAASEDERIRFEGFVPFERVLAIYEGADALVSMRLTKAINTRYFFPSKLMECLASGRPVISTKVGWVEEELGAVVWMVGDETAEGLAEAIRDVSAAPRAVRMDRAAKARTYMAQHKTWDAQAARIRAFLQGLF